MINKILERYLHTGQTVEISDAVLSKDAGCLYLTGTSNFTPDSAWEESIRREILAAVPGLKDVRLEMTVVLPALGIDDVLPAAMRLVQENQQDPWMRAVTPDGHVFEEQTLYLSVMGDYAAEQLDRSAADYFTRTISQELGRPVTVHFRQNEEAQEEVFADIKENWETPPEPEQPEEEKKRSFADGRIKGRFIEKPPIPMNQLPRDEVPVTVAGKIFSVETRRVKKSDRAMKFSKDKDDTSTLATIFMSDKTESVCVKMFCDNKEWAEIEGVMSPGCDIIVSGKQEQDQFLKSMVIRARDIGTWKMPEREDTCEEKRIELHAHTKMSALDGLSDPKALVKRAVKWGHKAIAITDHGVVHALPKAFEAGGDKIKVILGTEGYLYDDAGKIDENGEIDYMSGRTYHIVVLAKNLTGRTNLYKLISYSHMDYFYKKPRLPRSILQKYREGLILGSACQAGELYQAIVNGAPDEELLRIADFYDYLEVQPQSNNVFMIEDPRYPMINTEEDIRRCNRKVLELGKRLGKPVVATSDTHYIDPEDNILREIIRAGQGYSDIGGDHGLFFRTTDEMLEEFSYFDEQDRYDVVIGGPAKIAEMCEKMPPAPGREFPRPSIKDADKILRESCENKLHERYGDPAPQELVERLNKELDSIIDNGYAVMYVSAKMLVDKSNSDGYIVGSRGSVGSSFAAFMSGISEVNPLAAHYVCPHCKHFEWGDTLEYECGVDMPPKDCPECGTPMERDGYSIPFETFLGFTGNKEPDIDLNFAGEYQATAQKYVDEIFGAKNTYKAGTVGTVAEKTAYGFISAYSEATHKSVSRFDRERLAKGCEDVKRTTGQHPGGIIVVPEGHEIFEVTPIQYPANKKESGIVTTHFEYHSFEEALLKLDILGHDGPTLVRLLHNSTGIDPQTVPINDPKVMALFAGTSSLDIKDPSYRFTDGSYGVPEFGTPIARGMLNDTHPKCIGDLVRLSGLAHGTDVWSGNAQELIKKGIATMGEVIATRDDIMTYLIEKGLPKPEAFNIMERVRKGKVAAGKVKEWPEWSNDMRQHGVPEWYIGSCEKIKYMFPRGHAAAYVIMSCRVAYFKVYYPAHFYAARFTTKVEDFNWDVVKGGIRMVESRMDEIDQYLDEVPPGKTVTKEKNEKTLLEVIYEMLARGYEFEAPSFEYSAADHFTVHDNRVVVSLNALEGIGTSAARAIMDAYNERPFETIEDIQVRGKANKTAIEALRGIGLLDGMDESNQLSFF